MIASAFLATFTIVKAKTIHGIISRPLGTLDKTESSILKKMTFVTISVHILPNIRHQPPNISDVLLLPPIANASGAVIVSTARITYLSAISSKSLNAVSAGDDLPEVLKWKDSYLSPKSFVLVLGESYTGPVTVNLAHIPHILLGGSTGSGKSVLLKLLLMQALRKGAEVYIADFKGGVDFPKVWHEKCRMCFAEEDLCNILDQLVEELERRKSAFKALGCPNIDAYNEIAERPLQRLIFACDEVAEMLDKTGADSERKKLLAQIENKLSTIAR